MITITPDSNDTDANNVVNSINSDNTNVNIDTTNGININAITLANNISNMMGDRWVYKSSSSSSHRVSGGDSYTIYSYAFVKMGPRSSFNVSYNVGGQQILYAGKLAPNAGSVTVAVNGSGMTVGGKFSSYYNILRGRAHGAVGSIFGGQSILISCTDGLGGGGETVMVNANTTDQLTTDISSDSWQGTYKVFYPNKSGNSVVVRIRRILQYVDGKYVQVDLGDTTTPTVDPNDDIAAPSISWGNMIGCNISCQDKIYNCSVTTIG